MGTLVSNTMTLADKLVERAILIPSGDHTLISSLEAYNGVSTLPELIGRLEGTAHCPQGLLEYLKSPGLDLDHTSSSAPSSASTPAPAAAPTTAAPSASAANKPKPKLRRVPRPERPVKRTAERMTQADPHHASAHLPPSPPVSGEPQAKPVPTAMPIPEATRASPADADAIPAARAEVRPVRLGHHSGGTILRDRRARASRLSNLVERALESVIENDRVTIQPDVRVFDKPMAYEMHVTFPRGVAIDSAAAARVSLNDDHTRLTIEGGGAEGGVSQRVRDRVVREVMERAARTDNETLDALEADDLVPLLEELLQDSHGYRGTVSYAPSVYQLPTDGSVQTNKISRQQISRESLLITVPKANAVAPVKHMRQQAAAAQRRMTPGSHRRGRGMGPFYDPACGVGYGAPAWAARAW